MENDGDGVEKLGLNFRFSEIVQEALEEICLTEVVECTMNMCMLEYYCIMVNDYFNELICKNDFCLCYRTFSRGEQAIW